MDSQNIARVETDDETGLEQAPAASGVQSGAANQTDDRLDFFIKREGIEYAGAHVIVDLFGAQGLDQLEDIDRTLRFAAEKAGATVLSIDLHHFSPNGGVSGVAVLAESHISIHTWPERGFAAVDIFMCGDARPMQAVKVLRAAFQPAHLSVQEFKRGIVS